MSESSSSPLDWGSIDEFRHQHETGSAVGNLDWGTIDEIGSARPDAEPVRPDLVWEEPSGQTDLGTHGRGGVERERLYLLLPGLNADRDRDLMIAFDPTATAGELHSAMDSNGLSYPEPPDSTVPAGTWLVHGGTGPAYGGSDHGSHRAARLETPVEGLIPFRRPRRDYDALRMPAELHLPLPADPEPPSVRWIEALIALLPVVVLVVVYLALGRDPTIAIIIGATGAASLAAGLWRRFDQKRRHRERLDEVDQQRAAAREEVLSTTCREHAALCERFPSPDELLRRGTERDARLWNERSGNHLVLRLGTVGLPSKTVLVDNEAPTVDNAPLCVDLTLEGVLAVEGSVESSDGVVSGLVAQMATRFAPSDLEFVVLARNGWPKWRWSRWLPHLRASSGGLCRIATDSKAIRRYVNELNDVIDGRIEALAEANDVRFRPIVVIIEDQESISRAARLTRLLTDGPTVGIYSIVTSGGFESTDERATVSLTLHTDDDLATFSSDDRQLLGVSPDRWVEELELFARSLAGLALADSGEGRVPATSSYRQHHRSTFESSQLARQWQKKTTPNTIFGVLDTADGIIEYDFAHVRHLVVTGASGSGKTEFVLAMIADLAARNRPGLLDVFIAGWKGTADFATVAGLPHTAVLCGNEDEVAALHAFRTLEAELLRRNEQLLDLRDTGQISESNIYAAWKEVPAKAARCRLSPLVIVIDEFAQLRRAHSHVRDLTDRILQQGRSLGMHLVLVAQDPTDAITDDVRTNAQLRIAFAALTAQNSKDTIGAIDAFLIPPELPGRGFAKRQSERIVEFQASRINGQSASDDHQPCHFTKLSQKEWVHGEIHDPGASGHQIRDLDVLVASAQDAAETATPPASLFPTALGTTAPDRPPGAVGLFRNYGASTLTDREGHYGIDPTSFRNMALIGEDATERAEIMHIMCLGISESDPDAQIVIIDLDGGHTRRCKQVPNVKTVVENDPWLINWLIAELDSAFEERALDDAPTTSPIYLMVNGWSALQNVSGPGLDDGIAQSLPRLITKAGSLGFRTVLGGVRGFNATAIEPLLDKRLALSMSRAARDTAVPRPSRTLKSQPPRLPRLRAVDIDDDFIVQFAKVDSASAKTPEGHTETRSRFRTAPVKRNLCSTDTPHLQPPVLWLGQHGASNTSTEIDLSRFAAVVVIGQNTDEIDEALLSIAEAAEINGWHPRTLANHRVPGYDWPLLTTDEESEPANSLWVLPPLVTGSPPTEIGTVLSKTFGGILIGISFDDYTSSVRNDPKLAGVLDKLAQQRIFLRPRYGELGQVSREIAESQYLSSWPTRLSGIWLNKSTPTRIILPDRRSG